MKPTNKRERNRKRAVWIVACTVSLLPEQHQGLMVPQEKLKHCSLTGRLESRMEVPTGCVSAEASLVGSQTQPSACFLIRTFRVISFLAFLCPHCCFLQRQSLIKVPILMALCGPHYPLKGPHKDTAGMGHQYLNVGDLCPSPSSRPATGLVLRNPGTGSPLQGLGCLLPPWKPHQQATAPPRIK